MIIVYKIAKFVILGWMLLVGRLVVLAGIDYYYFPGGLHLIAGIDHYLIITFSNRDWILLAPGIEY